MPNNDFSGKTFVAFVDISGFKNMMQKKQAGDALMEFYSIGYRTLGEHPDISGVFISDCGILYHNGVAGDINTKLQSILDAIKKINEKMLEKNYLLTTSIAYGEFEYRNKIELENMTKNSFQGYAYLDAYLDSEDKGIHKLKAGECRVLISDDLGTINLGNPNIKKTSKHFYYYWMLQENQTIAGYEQNVKSIENKYTKKSKKINDEKFEELKQLLKEQN
ncbi:MAG: hypothetical protein WBK95_10390 [Sulfurimonas sp.]|nr:hypothetical protein [Sulfurimonas sp.]